MPITDWKSRTIVGIGVRPGDRADDVVRVADVGDPVAHGVVEGVLERLRVPLVTLRTSAPSSFMRTTLSDWRCHILFTHVDDALVAEQGAGRGRGDAVLARAGLGDDARLVHAPREQDLAEGVVDLVCARCAPGPRA